MYRQPPPMTKRTLSVHVHSKDAREISTSEFDFSLGRCVENVREVRLGDVVFTATEQTHPTIVSDVNDTIVFDEGVRIRGGLDGNDTTLHRNQMFVGNTLVTIPCYLNRVVKYNFEDTMVTTMSPHGLETYRTWTPRDGRERPQVISVGMSTNEDIRFDDDSITIHTDSKIYIGPDNAPKVYVGSVGSPQGANLIAAVEDGFLHMPRLTRAELADLLTHCSGARFDFDGRNVVTNTDMYGPLADFLRRAYRPYVARLPSAKHRKPWDLTYAYRRSLSWTVADVSHYPSSTSPSLSAVADFAFVGSDGATRVIALRGGRYKSPHALASAIAFQMNRLDVNGPYFESDTPRADADVTYAVTFDDSTGRFRFQTTPSTIAFKLIFRRTDFVSIVPKERAEPDLIARMLGMRPSTNYVASNGIIESDVPLTLTRRSQSDDDDLIEVLDGDAPPAFAYPALYHRADVDAATRRLILHADTPAPATSGGDRAAMSVNGNEIVVRRTILEAGSGYRTTNVPFDADYGDVVRFRSAFARVFDTTMTFSVVVTDGVVTSASTSDPIENRGACFAIFPDADDDESKGAILRVDSDAAGNALPVRVLRGGSGFASSGDFTGQCVMGPYTQNAVVKRATDPVFGTDDMRDGSKMVLVGCTAALNASDRNLDSLETVRRPNAFEIFREPTTARDILGLTRDRSGARIDLDAQFTLNPAPFAIMTLEGDTAIVQNHRYVLSDRREIPDVFATLVFGSTFASVRSQVFHASTGENVRWSRVRVKLLTPDGRPFPMCKTSFYLTLLFTVEEGISVLH